MNFDKVIEEQIRKAQEEGKFRNLRGQGKRLNLDENPFEDPAMRMANHMLKENGFRPEWLKDDIVLREQYERARKTLARSRDWRASQLQQLAGQTGADAIEQRELVAQEWALAQARFRTSLAEINKALFTFNLKVPNARLQRRKLDVEAEIAQIVASSDQGKARSTDEADWTR